MKREPLRNNIRCVFFAAVPAVLFAVYCVLDYLDVPGLLGLSFSRINVDLFGCFLDAAIVVILYIITYYLVDRRQMQKDINARNTANILLLNTYQECLINLRIVADTDTVSKYIVPKIDFNSTIGKEGVLPNLQNFPFQSQDKLLELAEAGYVESEVLETYFHIQKEHRQIINMKIIMFDLTNPKTAKERELYSENDRQYKDLCRCLNREIKRLEPLCKV